MKKFFIIVICLIVFLDIVFGINKAFNKMTVNEISNDEISENIEEINDENQNIVKIVNGKIQNEYLIDEFIEKTSNAKESANLKIQDIIIDDSSDFIEIEFVPSKIQKTEESEADSYINSPQEEINNMYGYYVLTRNDKEIRFDCLNYYITRNTMDKTVYLIFDTVLGDSKEDPLSLICSYDLDLSNYKKDFELNFFQRKDMGEKKIIGPESSVIPIGYSVYTVGGDVTFTIENDMVYDFEKALKEKVITVEQILEQAKLDDKYGICKEEMYSDGGTLEYLYDDYTILKYNTLNGNEDLVIGPKGSIRNQVDKIIYK